MKALLMAAGVGSRISRHLNGQPKCCVKIGNEMLIVRTFKLLLDLGINDIAIVTGYAEKYILNALKEYKFTHFQNPFFDITNSIASAYLAREFLDDDIIMMNADVFIEKKGLEELLHEQKSPVFLADSTRIEDADYKFYWENNILKNYGKELTHEQTKGEYVGIAKISKNDIEFFKNELKRLVESQKHDYWWEDVFYANNQKDIFIKDIKGHFWAEVDYIEDYERIKEYLKENHE